MKVSVVISAYNEEDKLDECLASVKNIAQEIIVVDSGSTDKTSDIAKKYTDKVFPRQNNPMLNVNKNFGFTKASGEWILCLDADERVEKELADEILHLDDQTQNNGFFIPRKNIIFGKWIQNTGWYPDYQLRLFRKEKGRFEEKHVHELVTVDGVSGHLRSNIIHYNYETISQFLEKMIRIYTENEADSLMANGYKFDVLDAFKMPINEFVSRFFARGGYKDGLHGFVLSTLMGFYHFVVFLRLWEKNKFIDDQNGIQLFEFGRKYTGKQIAYWVANAKLQDEKNLLKKQILKLKRKRNAS